MSNNQMTLVYSTIDSSERARSLASLVIASGNAACANIIGPGQSVYMWNEEIKIETEFYIIFKTTTPDLLVDFLKINHPYDLPAIIEISATTTPAFFRFLAT